MMARTTTSDDKSIGTKLRVLRVAAGMNQTDLGAALGVTFQQIQKYEKGVNRVQAGRLTVIAKALGCTVADILDTGEVRSDPAMKMLQTSQGRRLAEGYLRMDRDQRRALVDLVDTIISAN